MEKQRLRTRKWIYILPMWIMCMLGCVWCTGIKAYAAVNNGYEYKVLEDGTVEVIGYSGQDTKITIPSKIEGKPVTSIGGFYNCSKLTSVIIPSSVTRIEEHAFKICPSLVSVTIPSSVTSIGAYSFMYTGLRSVTIPSSVTSIGSYAFGSSDRLTSIIVDSQNKTYKSGNSNAIIEKSSNTLIVGCSKTIIPSSVTGIGDGAFYSCSGLRSITIPSSVTSIGDSAFDSSGLTSITIPSSVTQIGYRAFYSCSGLTSITILSGSIGEEAFAMCSGLMNVTISSGVTSIGDSAFYSCSGLTSVTISSGVTSIGEYAFGYCSGLTNVTISSGNIGKYAFAMCSRLTNVIISSGVTSIGYKAFSTCSGLIGVIIKNGQTSIDINAFHHCPETMIIYTVKASRVEQWANNRGFSVKDLSEYTPDTSAIPQNPDIPKTPDGYEYKVLENGTVEIIGYSGKDTKITIPSKIKERSVTNIGDYAFSNCSGLTSITIPSGVTSIGNFAFEGCSGLTSITIPSGVTIIGSYTFFGCYSLTGITIPSGVTSIEGSAFGDCSGLKSITIPSSVISIGNFAFEGCSGLTSITIPSGVTSIGHYAFAGCSGLKSITIANGETSIGNNVFSGCSKNMIIYTVKGSSVEQWANNKGFIVKEAQTTLPKVGSKHTVSKGVYKVTKSSSTKKEVTFMKPTSNKKKSFTVPATVMIKGRAYKVTEIASKAFNNNKKLKSVTIGKNVKKIGKNAFFSCKKLKKITIKSTVLKSVGKNAIKGIHAKAVIKCPKKQLKKYKKLFKSKTGYKKTMKIKK